MAKIILMEEEDLILQERAANHPVVRNGTEQEPSWVSKHLKERRLQQEEPRKEVESQA